MKTCQIFTLAAACLLAGLFYSCAQVKSQEAVNISKPEADDFGKYWYAGKAELTRYALQQARYGEIHEGDAVLIFVTEDFLSDKQVKYEGGEQEEEVLKIMKLNFTKNFLTGIYPYSMMSSVFTPIDRNKQTLKVTTSSQEWCGHTYSQLNFRNGKYEGVLHSYFQNEGDQAFTLADVMLEDEVWTKIRLQPDQLPTGDIQLIPATQFLRLRHREFAVENATATLLPTEDAALSDKPLSTYRIEYKDFKRVLEITFETTFPYTIQAWQEEVESGWPEAKTLTTRAVRTHSIMSAYWGQHDVKDRTARKELGLSER